MNSSSLLSSSVSLIASSSAPVTAFPPLSSPACFAIATAVSLWSPVIITVFIFAPAHFLIASLASSLGGSCIAASPRKTSPLPEAVSLLIDFSARASTLKALDESELISSSIFLLNCSVIGFSPSDVIIKAHFLRSISGAPLRYSVTEPELDFIFTDMNFVLLSKGISDILRISLSPFFVNPPLAAAISRAASVGFPLTCQLPPPEIDPLFLELSLLSEDISALEQ